jgi:uncharacterized protein
LQLYQFFKQNPRIAVAYSGGVDSSYLLYAAKAAGCDVRAYFIKSQFQPEFELVDAKRLTEFLGLPLIIGTLDVLCDENIYLNRHNRCYHCKTAILKKIWELAQADGITVLCDGTNADDDETGRPGMRALRELGVVSPLRDCGITKEEIRRLSKLAGLFTNEKPSYACLATRIPTGMTITPSLLEKIETAENALFDMGFTDFRIRVRTQGDGSVVQGAGSGIQVGESGMQGSGSGTQDNAALAFRLVANIQMPENQWNTAAEKRIDILNALKPIFDSVALDLATR